MYVTAIHSFSVCSHALVVDSRLYTKALMHRQPFELTYFRAKLRTISNRLQLGRT